MKDIQVKTYYNSSISGHVEIKQCAYQVDNETVFLYNTDNIEAGFFLLTHFENEIHFSEISKDMLLLLNGEMGIEKILLKMNIPTNYMFKKIELNTSYIFVSDIGDVGYDISLIEDENFCYWDPIKSFFSKAKSPTKLLQEKNKEA